MSLPTVKIIVGNSLDRLRQLPDESVNCVVTSPPYWGLRDYNVEGQIGLEETFEAFLDRLAAVFAEVRLVLRADGTAWVNMGDSYASDAYGGSVGGACTLEGSRANLAASRRARTKARIPTNCKPKDLIGQPWELALRLRRDGWYWRKAIVWHKPSPMPESVKDRPTSSWEPVLLFSKSERYSYDADAIKEPCVAPQSNKPDDWERAVNRRRMTTATLRQGTYTVGNQDDRATKNRTPRPGIDDSGGRSGFRNDFIPDRLSQRARRLDDPLETIQRGALRDVSAGVGRAVHSRRLPDRRRRARSVLRRRNYWPRCRTAWKVLCGH